MPPAQRRVLIIGGSFSGLCVARDMATHFLVTIVDCKEFFEYTPGILRCFVKPKHFDSLSFNLHPVIENRMGCKFIWGEVTKLENNRTATIKPMFQKEEEVIDFDFCIIASGCNFAPFDPIGESLWFPVVHACEREESKWKQFDERFIEGRRRHIFDEYNKLAKLNKDETDILVIGAGFIGVEWITELQHFFPQLKLTILDFLPTCLGPLPPAAADYCCRYMTNASITQVYKTKYEPDSDDFWIKVYLAKNEPTITADTVVKKDDDEKEKKRKEEERGKWKKLAIPFKTNAKRYDCRGVKASNYFMDAKTLSDKGPGGGKWILMNKQLAVTTNNPKRKDPEDKGNERTYKEVCSRYRAQALESLANDERALKALKQDIQKAPEPKAPEITEEELKKEDLTREKKEQKNKEEVDSAKKALKALGDALEPQWKALEPHEKALEKVQTEEGKKKAADKDVKEAEKVQKDPEKKVSKEEADKAVEQAKNALEQVKESLKQANEALKQAKAALEKTKTAFKQALNEADQMRLLTEALKAPKQVFEQAHVQAREHWQTMPHDVWCKDDQGYPRIFAVGDCNYSCVPTDGEKPKLWEMPPIAKISYPGEEEAVIASRNVDKIEALYYSKKETDCCGGKIEIHDMHWPWGAGMFATSLGPHDACFVAGANYNLHSGYTVLWGSLSAVQKEIIEHSKVNECEMGIVGRCIWHFVHHTPLHLWGGGPRWGY